MIQTLYSCVTEKSSGGPRPRWRQEQRVDLHAVQSKWNRRGLQRHHLHALRQVQRLDQQVTANNKYWPRDVRRGSHSVCRRFPDEGRGSQHRWLLDSLHNHKKVFMQFKSQRMSERLCDRQEMSLNHRFSLAASSLTKQKVNSDL